MSWIGIKAKLYTAAAALLTILGLILRNRYLKAKAEKQKHRADVAEAGLRRKIEDEKRETEIDSDWSDKERVANENLDDIPDFLRKRRMHNDPD